jgi:hypothetical protein
MVLWRGAPLSRARGRCSQLSYPDPPSSGKCFREGRLPCRPIFLLVAVWAADGPYFISEFLIAFTNCGVKF